MKLRYEFFFRGPDGQAISSASSTMIPDAFDGEGDMAEPRGVRRRVLITTFCRRRMELRQLHSSVAGWGLQHRNLCPDAVESHDEVHPATLDRSLAPEINETQLSLPDFEQSSRFKLWFDQDATLGLILPG